MASQQKTVVFIIEQIGEAGRVAARKMFGEYCIYCDDKMVGLVADDLLFIKPTAAGRAYIGDVIEQPPYPGAKPCFLIPGERWEERDWLTELVRRSAMELPVPSKSRATKKRRAG